MMNQTLQSTQIEKEKDFYVKFGKDSAARADGQPGLIKESLNVLYEEIVKKAGQDKQGIAALISTLKENIKGLEKQKDVLEVQKASTENKIEDCTNQIDDLENERGTPDFIPFVVGAFITILLTFYLWAFYSASGYAAYAGVPPESTGFEGVFSALSEAFSDSGALKIIAILFPTVFLGLGFLIHDSIEKKKYGFIALLLSFTFIFDVIIGFMVTKHLHMNDIINNRTTAEWSNWMVLEDITFYFILASGFVCYVMWGFLLNYTLNKWNEMQPSVRMRKLKDQVIELKQQMKKCEGDVLSIENEIKGKEQDIIAYKTGKVIIDIPTLKAHIGHFMSGWAAWIVLMKENSSELSKEADIEKERWLDEKVNNLTSVISEPNLSQNLSYN
jgi:uncharacterized membrane protein (DUF106 family)